MIVLFVSNVLLVVLNVQVFSIVKLAILVLFWWLVNVNLIVVQIVMNVMILLYV